MKPQITPETLRRAENAGREAYKAGRCRAPATDPAVMQLVGGWPVGVGAALVFRAFTAGFDAEAEAATAAVLVDPEPVYKIDDRVAYRLHDSRYERVGVVVGVERRRTTGAVYRIQVEGRDWVDRMYEGELWPAPLGDPSGTGTELSSDCPF